MPSVAYSFSTAGTGCETSAEKERSMGSAQTRNIRRFGGDHYASTAVDVVGLEVLRLLQQAERKEGSRRVEPIEERIEMLA